MSPLVVNNKPFNITVQGSTPLTSRLMTPSPMNDLNGTEVLCMAIDDVITSSATIHITEGGTCFVYNYVISTNINDVPIKR